jgi:LAO/AO transport system kinase
MGDEVQAMKAGLLEVADLVVVNKSDRPGAGRAAAQLKAMLALGGTPDGPGDRRRPKRPQVLLVSGLAGDGVPELLAALDGRQADRVAAGTTQASRIARARAQVEGILADRAREALWSDARRAETDALLDRVAAHELDPYAAADQLLGHLAGLATRPKRSLRDLPPPAPRRRGERPLTDVLREMRDAER